MADEAPAPADRLKGLAADDRLDSWKEIAAYLRRDAATVRRWEKREGLPVHRHSHDRRDTVFGYKSEIDRWWDERSNGLDSSGRRPAGPDSGDAQTAARLASAPSGRRAPGRSRVLWALSFLGLALAGAFGALVTRAPVHERAQVRFSISLAEGSSFGHLTLSPDGRLLAFTAPTGQGPEHLWVRRLDSLTAQPLVGTAHASYPFWSPDSQFIGFFADGKLKSVGASGGVPQIICDASAGRGGTWSRDGVILFSAHRAGELLRVQASGGSPVSVTTVERPRERGHLWPEFLPDGRHFLFLADSTEPEHHKIWVGLLGASTRQHVVSTASNAMYAPEGYLLFNRDRQLVAQRFDAKTLGLAGDPVVLAENVHEPPDHDHRFEFAVSQTGILAYRTVELATRLVWRDRTGGRADFVETPALYATPTLSPDRTRVAVDIFDPHPSRTTGFGLGEWTSDIWLLDVSTATGSRLTFDPAADFNPVWSPDGTRVVFSSNRRGRLDLYERTAGGREVLLLASAPSKHAFTWSPDGRFLLYGTTDPRTQADIWMLPMVGDRTPVRLLGGPFSESQPQISPDGRWIAYTSNESGRIEVYVQSFPALEGKWQISNAGGGDPRWRADGRELFYIAADGHLMAVAVKAARTFEPGIAVSLFDTGLRPDYGDARNHYDVSRDGRRFLMMQQVRDAASAPFTMVVGWRGW